MTMVAEICGKTFANQSSTLLNISPQLVYGLLLEHEGIRKIDEFVLRDVVYRNKIGLNV